MEKYILAIKKIVLAQKQVIGPVAYKLAANVDGLEVDLNSEEVTLQGDPKQTMESLINAFASIFGEASIKLSVEEIQKANLGFSTDELPAMFKSV